MESDEFIRRYPLHASQFAWLLGAGASAGAGVPTAGMMVWEFKRAIYCSQQGVPVHGFANLADPAVQRRIQSYFDSVGGYPASGSSEEYATYFEKAYPLETSRQAYIESKVFPATPSHGHRVLAALAATGHTRIIWTTNFDRLVEDALAEFLKGSGSYRVATHADPSVARQAVISEKWPLVGKLHGDFQSQSLKNISSELRQLDEELRQEFINICRNFGMIVVGYSGRDSSVMSALRAGIHDGKGFPAGFIWVRRLGSAASPEVEALLAEMRAAGIHAEGIQSGTFDEFLTDVLDQCDFVPDALREKIGKAGDGRRSAAPIPPPGVNTWPLIRTNAIQVEIPVQARLVECKIGGQKEVNQAIAAESAPIIARRKREGVLAFGSDSLLRSVFGKNDSATLSLVSLEEHRLYHDSTETGLLNEALALGLARIPGLESVRRRHEWHICVAKDLEHLETLQALRNATKGLSGNIPHSTLMWREAVQVNLQYRLGRCWLILNPTVLVDWQGLPPTEKGKDFIRSRRARRFNQASEAILDGWLAAIFGARTEKHREIRALNIGDGVDAVFQLHRKSAISRKVAKR
jgi:hypothetical protein